MGESQCHRRLGWAEIEIAELRLLKVDDTAHGIALAVFWVANLIGVEAGHEGKWVGRVVLVFGAVRYPESLGGEKEGVKDGRSVYNTLALVKEEKGHVGIRTVESLG